MKDTSIILNTTVGQYISIYLLLKYLPAGHMYLFVCVSEDKFSIN